MLIFELFDKPAEITYTKIQPNDVIAAFRVGDIDYMFQAVSYGDDRVFDVAFEGGGEFGITWTGNAPVVFATVITILQRVLQECDIDVLRFEVDKDEPSRLKLYKRLVSKLIPKWTMHYLHSEYHYDIYVTNPNASTK